MQIKLPEGWYVVSVIEGEAGPLPDDVILRLKVEEGSFAGTTMRVGFPIDRRNENVLRTASELALTDLAYCCGITRPTDTRQLENIPFRAYVRGEGSVTAFEDIKCRTAQQRFDEKRGGLQNGTLAVGATVH